MKFLLHILQQFISPLVPIPEPDEYQQSRILASISLAVLFVALFGIALSSPSYTGEQVVHIAPVIAGYLLFLIPYYQSRRGNLHSAAINIAIIALMLITVAALSLGGDIGRDLLNYNVIVILFSIVFLSHNYTILFVFLDFACILLFGVLNPDLSIIALIRGPLVFNIIVTFFIILLSIILRRREIEKRQYLQESERQKAQLLLKREQYAVLSQFVEAMSHDLRTRLSLIETNRFFVKRLLENDPISERAEGRLNNIRDIINDIDQQIGNLNVIVNLGDPIMEYVDLNAVVDKVHKDMQAISESQGIELVKQTAPESITVISNFNHLCVALTHLTQNALTYSNTGDTVTVSVSQTVIHGHIVVQDTGIGVSDDHLSHLFDIFYKTNAARTTTQAGLGLGLTIVKLIAEAYSGTIEVESVEGEGSTFTLCLPLEAYPILANPEEIVDSKSALLIG